MVRQLNGAMMIGHTKAFVTYKDLSQGYIDFVVLVCHAIPALRADIGLLGRTLSNPPDYFKASKTTKTRMASIIGDYQTDLARSNLITAFSYFESYIKEALREIVGFHGGSDKFKKLAIRQTGKFINSTSSDIKLNKRKIQDNPVPEKFAKYQKYGRLLENKGYKFPTELFAYYGVSQFLPKLQDDRRGMKASEIPSLLEECLLFPITKTERDHFEEVRSLRNKISHGGLAKIDLQKSLRHGSILHTLAAKVDRHIVEHFLVIQSV